MLRTFTALMNDDCGFVLSAELVLVMTVGVLAMIVGLSEVAVAVNTELNDISNAIGKLDQSYYYTGFKSCEWSKKLSRVAGSAFSDSVDNGDTNQTCDIVAGASHWTGEDSYSY